MLTLAEHCTVLDVMGLGHTHKHGGPDYADPETIL